MRPNQHRWTYTYLNIIRNAQKYVNEIFTFHDAFYVAVTSNFFLVMLTIAGSHTVRHERALIQFDMNVLVKQCTE